MEIKISEETLEILACLVSNKIIEHLDVEQVNSIPEYFSKREAAEYLNISLNTLDKYIKNGLEVYIISDEAAVRLSRTTIDKFMNTHKMKGDN